MKKRLIIITLLQTAFSITAFSYYENSNTPPESARTETESQKHVLLSNDFIELVKKNTQPNFFYKVSSRFNTVISKEELMAAKSIIDILPKEETEDKKDYQSVSQSIVNEDAKRKLIKVDEIQKKYGNNEVLTDAQLELIKTVEYSTNILLIAYCQRLNLENKKWESYKIVYHMTVVPEKEASYIDGNDELMNYLKKESWKKANVTDPDSLKPGRLSFTISTYGMVENINLLSTSAYEELDEDFMKIISSTSKKWNIARNSKGEKVEQEFIFSYGKMGC